jgi:L-iditol 2-dehydrogenase
MRVAVYHSNQDVRIEERDRPRIGPGEILLRIEASGICGSDVFEAYRRPRAPSILGHEVTGVVVETGAEVAPFRPGDRVVATHHVPCFECSRCRAGHPSTCEMLRTTHFDPGGFAEFARVPAPQVRRGMLALPDEVSFEEGSFVEPLACVVQGQRFASVTAAHSVAVIGSGLSGLLHVRLARATGARVLAVDISPYRLQAASQCGAEAVLPAGDDLPERLRRANGGRLADRVIVCTAAGAAQQQAPALAEPGGTVLYFAPCNPGETVPLPLFDLWRDEITVTFSYAASGDDLGVALELIRSGRLPVGDLISHRLPLAQAARGFALTARGVESLKVILLPSS